MRKDSLAQCLVWAIVRLLTLATLPLYPPWVGGDMTLYGRWADTLAAGGTLDDPTWQYPPGVALLLWMVGASGTGFWGIIGLILIADATIMAVARGTRGGWLWASAPLLVGPVFILRLDVIVTAFAVLGVVTTRHGVRSGALLGLGAALKIWPLALAAAYRREGGIIRGVAGLVAAILLAVVAQLALGGTGFAANQGGRGLQVEAAAAWPFMVAKMLGADVPLEYRFGSTEIDLPAASAIATALVPLAIVVLIVITFWSWRSAPSTEVLNVAPRALVIVVSLMLLSRVLSPQFNIWMLGIVVVALLTTDRSRSRLVLPAVITAAAGQVLYPHAYLDFLEGGLVGMAVQTVRLAALVWLLVATFMLCRQPASAPEVSPSASPIAGTHA